MLTEGSKPKLFVVVNNHFDLTWRRCWLRPFTYQGQTYISYSDLEFYYLQDNIALAQKNPNYKFEVESTQVARRFVERRPDYLPVLQQLASEGRFAVTGGGEAIVDSNLILGESLVRNYVDGLLWVEKTFGQKTRLAVRNDAFGNSAQLPQVLRGCEIAWATGMSYTSAEGLYWRGLDGSAILHQSLPVIERTGGNWKYPPCPDCSGTGKVDGLDCPTCAGRGISATIKSILPSAVRPDSFGREHVVMVLSMPEEMLPNPALIDWVQQTNALCDAVFALEEDVLPHIRPLLDRVDNPAPEDVHPSPELNPNNSGCWVTRIKTKQAVRRQEHALLAAEALSVMAALKGQAYPEQRLKRIRQDQFFTQFHDAITATHVNASYTELEETYQSIDHETNVAIEAAVYHLAQPVAAGGVISVVNPTGQPVTAVVTATLSTPEGSTLVDETGNSTRVLSSQPADGEKTRFEFVAEALEPFSSRQYFIAPSTEDHDLPEVLQNSVIENSRFRVEADEFGLISVFDKKLQRPVSISDDLRPGELLLEHDEGSPWATLHHDQTRTRLSPLTRLCAVEKKGPAQRMIFEVEAPREMGFAGKCLTAQVMVTLVEGIERVDFNIEADWQAFNHRLRFALPVPSQPGSMPKHVYEIPYGMLERKPYTPSFRWAGANGDWPATHWAGIEQNGLSVALLNQGTPSYRMETGPGSSEIILVSILRSPAVPTYLHEPEFYSMTDWDGMRDSGKHDFALAISAYDRPFAESSVVLDGEAYNSRPVVVEGAVDLPPMPRLLSGTARISAVKWAEEEPGAIILRLVEFRGLGGETQVEIPPVFHNAAKVNLLERQGCPLPIQNGSVCFSLRPWEIATLKLWL